MLDRVLNTPLVLLWSSTSSKYLDNCCPNCFYTIFQYLKKCFWRPFKRTLTMLTNSKHTLNFFCSLTCNASKMLLKHMNHFMPLVNKLTSLECVNSSVCAPYFFPLFYLHWHKFLRHVTSRLCRSMSGPIRTRKCRSTNWLINYMLHTQNKTEYRRDHSFCEIAEKSA